jgi:ferredoxin
MRCKECSKICPVGATSVEQVVLTDQSMCIRCSACVKSCPHKAMAWHAPQIAAAAASLSAKCHQRKGPKVFL